MLRSGGVTSPLLKPSGALRIPRLSVTELDVDSLLSLARRQLERVGSPAYLEELVGTIGSEPFQGQRRSDQDRVHTDQGQVHSEAAA